METLETELNFVLYLLHLARRESIDINDNLTTIGTSVSKKIKVGDIKSVDFAATCKLKASSDLFHPFSCQCEVLAQELSQCATTPRCRRWDCNKWQLMSVFCVPKLLLIRNFPVVHWRVLFPETKQITEGQIYINDFLFVTGVV